MRNLSKQQGISVVEIIVAIGIFVLLSASMVPLFLGSHGSNLRDKERFQADMYLQETTEALHSIKSYSFASLTNGTYGLTDASGYWGLSGASDTNGQYTRTITISDVYRDGTCALVPSGTSDPNTKKVVSTITWDLEEGNTTSVSSTEYYTNLADTSGCGASSCLNVSAATGYLTGGDKKIEGMTIQNTCPYDITLDKITPTWTLGNSIEQIKINNTWVWRENMEGTPDGVQPSGTELDIDDTTFPTGGGTFDINHMGFDGAMTGDTFTITFTLTDGTTKYVELTPGASGDVTAPAPVSDLVASNPTSSTIDLAWTATGDDTLSGTATTYDIRYSAALITESNWNSATQVTGEPAPSIAGTPESMTITGLPPGTTYHYAIKVADEVPNTSVISNTQTIQTLAAGDQSADLTIDDTAVALTGNSKGVTGITIENTGASTITISSMTVSWTGGASGNNIQGITINGSSVWTGNSATGVLLDITDFPLSASTTYPITQIDFKKSMSGSNISILFTMLDGSTKTISNITP